MLVNGDFLATFLGVYVVLDYPNIEQKRGNAGRGDVNVYRCVWGRYPCDDSPTRDLLF
jgi:hypothetical protein